METPKQSNSDTNSLENLGVTKALVQAKVSPFLPFAQNTVQIDALNPDTLAVSIRRNSFNNNDLREIERHFNNRYGFAKTIFVTESGKKLIVDAKGSVFVIPGDQLYTEDAGDNQTIYYNDEGLEILREHVNLQGYSDQFTVRNYVYNDDMTNADAGVYDSSEKQVGTFNLIISHDIPITIYNLSTPKL
jgi:hypothetical protein